MTKDRLLHEALTQILEAAAWFEVQAGVYLVTGQDLSKDTDEASYLDRKFWVISDDGFERGFDELIEATDYITAEL